MSIQPHWQPARNSESQRLARRFAHQYDLTPDGVDRIFGTAERILGRGPASAAEATRTGLALGYVQSGKTMSFTALSALAADNGYQVVVALLGVTRLLTGQNSTRLEDDLELDERGDYAWVPIPVPTPSDADVEHLASTVTRALQTGRKVLLTCLKGHRRINTVVEVLSRVSFGGERALVIDDEADQVSLNTRVNEESGELSSTYAEIMSLRRALPRHLYVQYTATPYAPLLIHPSDELHPEFVEFLEPGPAYTGGQTFLIEHAEDVVRRVPEGEAADLEPDHLPPSLEQALADFIAGAALAEVAGDRVGPLSMLVHVSHLNDVQADFQGFLTPTLDAWRNRIRRDPSDPGRQDLLSILRSSRDDLVERGAPTAPEQAWEDAVSDALLMVELHLVNSRSGLDEIPWRTSPLHILVGGNKLDRGFTVRGLTVTYLTRRAVNSNVDTVEQRARFFGYKRDLLPYCRVYAPGNVVEALTQIVHTEEDLRARLREWQEDGRDLAGFASSVGLLTPSDLSPTRRTVIADPRLFRLNRWHTLLRPATAPRDVETNKGLVEGFPWSAAEEARFGMSHTHEHLKLPLTDVIELLQEWRVGHSAGWQHEQLIAGLRRLRERQPASVADVLRLRHPGGGPRSRTWADDERGIPNLMQGSDAKTGYPGDRSLEATDSPRVQLQVHDVAVPVSDEVIRLYTLALHVPPELALPGSIVRRGI